MTTQTVHSTAYSVGTLYIDGLSCGSCGVVFGLERSMLKDRRITGAAFYCPNGDRISYSEPDADRLRRELKAANDHRAALAAENDQLAASRRAYKGQVTKLRNRTLAGECPICGQHLRDLARHIGRQHPDEQPEVETTP